MADDKQRSEDQHLTWGIAVGVAIGAGLGVAMDNLAMGVGIGIAIGAGIGYAWSEQGKDKAKR